MSTTGILTTGLTNIFFLFSNLPSSHFCLLLENSLIFVINYLSHCAFFASFWNCTFSFSVRNVHFHLHSTKTIDDVVLPIENCSSNQFNSNPWKWNLKCYSMPHMLNSLNFYKLIPVMCSKSFLSLLVFRFLINFFLRILVHFNFKL